MTVYTGTVKAATIAARDMLSNDSKNSVRPWYMRDIVLNRYQFIPSNSSFLKNICNLIFLDKWY